MMHPLLWSDWRPLRGASRDPKIPNSTGLYRIRHLGFEGIHYIGQTSMGKMTLRKRIGHLRGTYQAEMPYRDPHTVAPALWAYYHQTGREYEVSVCPLQGDVVFHKSWETVAIALYRQEHGVSPSFNFGRMPEGYRISSGNNHKLVAAGKRYRGSYLGLLEDSHLLGIAPQGPVVGEVIDSDWCGLNWSPWIAVMDLPPLPKSTMGLYRLRHSGASALLYVGEGQIQSRIMAHLKKGNHAAHRQASFFEQTQKIECSWAVGIWPKHQRTELECDGIASHVLMTGKPPAAQFLG